MSMSQLDLNLSLQYAEEKFKLLFEYSPVGMALVDHETGEFLEVNHALLDLTGYTFDEFTKLNYWDITPYKYFEQEEQQIKDLNKFGRFGPNEKEYIKKNGDLVPIRISGFIMNDITGRKLVWGLIEDITLEKENVRIMTEIAFNDYLTKLPNRRLFNDRLNQLIARANRHKTSFAFLMLDLDHFKKINDTYGHPVGDQLLIHVADMLQSTLCRATDTIARIGGDEFALLIGDSPSIDTLKDIASQIIATSEQPLVLEENKLFCTFSIGIAVFPSASCQNQVDLYKQADQALYLAKQKGRNGYCFYHQNINDDA